MKCQHRKGHLNLINGLIEGLQKQKYTIESLRKITYKIIAKN